MEFTGEYYRCHSCGYIWDYMDICPNCGHDEQDTINANDIKKLAFQMFYEQDRLKKMLDEHGDL